MKNTLNFAWNALRDLNDKVISFVKENGGFINTQNNDGGKDNIYGYVINWGNDDVDEYRVIAVRVVNDVLEIAISPNSINYTEGMTEDDFTEEDWCVCTCDSSEVLFAQTILSIAESLEQYV